MLEFLYTGNYTVGCLIPEAGDPQLDNDMYGVCERFVDNVYLERACSESACVSEVEEATSEIILHSSENIGQDPIGGSDPKEDAVEFVIDPLAERHPCYFHMRVSGEADYFMISSLKTSKGTVSYIFYGLLREGFVCRGSQEALFGKDQLPGTKNTGNRRGGQQYAQSSKRVQPGN